MTIEIKNRFTDAVIFTCEGADLRSANLRSADLRDANLEGADLYCATLEGANLYGEQLTKNPLVITGLNWWVLITEKHMKVGCQTHTHDEWESFSMKQISAMDRHALKFWGQWEKTLLNLCRKHGETT